MYEWSDAWFLLCASNKSKLEDIIREGDVINHTTFVLEEINRALTLLIKNGYIKLENDKTISVLPKTDRLYNWRIKRAGRFNQVDAMQKNLNAQNDDTRLDSLIEYFDKKELFDAYKSYTRLFFKTLSKLEKKNGRKKDRSGNIP